MGLLTKLDKQFRSSAVWSHTDWNREWDAWFLEISALMLAAGRTTFTDDEWKTLNVIYDTAKAARRANNMPGLRDALSRYRAAVSHFLGTRDDQ